MVAELNASSYGLPADRAKPVLTLDQLGAVATAGLWNNL
jgi:hypothetical protein